MHHLLTRGVPCHCPAAGAQVENGKGAMPAWEGRLSDDEIQAVAAYVLKQVGSATCRRVRCRRAGFSP